MKKYIHIFTLSLTLFTCGRSTTEMKTPEDANKKLAEFIDKEKFVEENYYPGIANENMRPILTKKINEVAQDFKKIAESKNPTVKKYQKQISVGLSRFSSIYAELDTEDRERVCSYIEELMDIVELESSSGQLNNFMYGFDPN